MEVTEDIEELNRLLGLARRPRVQELLKLEIGALRKTLPVEEKAPRPQQAIYTTLESFSWDQDNGKVKIYVPIEGAAQEKVESTFKEWSFDVKINDVGGKNFRSGILKLNKAIDPEQSTVLVKPKRIVVTLKKKDKSHWADLRFKEETLKPKAGEGKDPMAGIMDLMKNMYDEGDEDMKRTIAQAWSDARTGKKARPFP